VKTERSARIRKLLPPLRRIRRSPREVSLNTLMKGTSIIMLGPLMLLAIYVLYGELHPVQAVMGAAGVFLVSILFVHPYIANLSALTYYVEQLADDKKADAPDLTFLNNVEELSKTVERLHKSWNLRRAQLENMLAESKIVIDNLPDVLIMLDRDMNVIRTNSTAQNVFGTYFKENIQKLLEDPDFKKVLEAAIRERKGQSTDYTLKEAETKEFVVRVEPLPVYAPGGIAIIIAMHDVTELKRTEQTFADFVANASHEIRTPLTSLIGFIETLQSTARDDPKAQQEFLGLMAEQADKMGRLVKDLLSLSKIERASMTLPSGKADIGRILKAVVRDSSHAAEKRSMKIQLKTGKLPSIKGDEDELALVFSNLIINAIKYGKEGTAIEVTGEEGDFILPRDKLIRSKEPCLAIAVKDHGPGIPREHIPRLTERFYRAEAARSKNISGSGLGLAIVKQVLDRHKGVLTIESQIGVGSTFTVLLPLQSKTALPS
jgi:two-component system phosphate regulon sensor histidine kinase PhoR